MIAVAIEEEKIRVLFDRVQWRFAKSMPKIPHWYTRRGDWQSENDFKWTVAYLNANSVSESFYGRTYKYFYLEGFKYWTMDENLNDVILINKARAK